jgi:hypothetical protein
MLVSRGGNGLCNLRVGTRRFHSYIHLGNEECLSLQDSTVLQIRRWQRRERCVFQIFSYEVLFRAQFSAVGSDDEFISLAVLPAHSDDPLLFLLFFFFFSSSSSQHLTTHMFLGCYKCKILIAKLPAVGGRPHHSPAHRGRRILCTFLANALHVKPC